MDTRLGVISDIDGVLWVDDGPAAGAREFIADVIADGHPCALLTNDCSVSERQRAAALRSAGFCSLGWSLLSAGGLVQRYLSAQGISTAFVLGAPTALLGEAVEMTTDPGVAEAVVVGDCFQLFDTDHIQVALTALDRGVPFLAAQRNRSWSDGARSYPDNGFFVAGLEYCAQREAVTLGKPASFAYLTAASTIERKPDEILFISDSADEVEAATRLDFHTLHMVGTEGFARARTLLGMR